MKSLISAFFYICKTAFIIKITSTSRPVPGSLYQGAKFPNSKNIENIDGTCEHYLGVRLILNNLEWNRFLYDARSYVMIVLNLFLLCKEFIKLGESIV